MVKNNNSLNKLKYNNRQEVLDVVRSLGSCSIAEIAKCTKLSKVTVNKCLDFYTEEGIIAAIGKGESSEDGGKRPNLFAFNHNYKKVFSVKIDEIQILTALTNLNGEILASHTILYNPKTELDNILKSIHDAFLLLLNRQRCTEEECIGASFGWLGIIDPDTGICFTSPHYSHWGKNISLLEKLQNLFPQNMAIYIDNWVHFHAYGEVKRMPSGVDKFFIISSEFEGVNGSFIVDGKLYRGVGSLSGEIGHMIVDTTENAEKCLCGGRGCLEAAVSPRRILSRFKQDVTLSAEYSMGDGADNKLNFQRILQGADEGDPVLRKIVDKSVFYFAVGINNIMQVCDPGLIIIQGEYVAGGEYFKSKLAAKIKELSLHGMEKDIRIEYSKLGDEGAIIGGSLYCIDKFFENSELNSKD